jgi:UDP-glucose 4-epimerase
MYLISGGGSQLGLNTAKALIARGKQVVLTTRRRDDSMAARVAEESGGRATVEVLNLTNAFEIANLMSRYDFKCVIHTASAHMYANTRAANFPSYEMLFNMLEASTSFGVERFVLCNSIVVYCGVEGPFREDQPLPPDFVALKTGTPFDFIPSFEVTLKRCMEAIAMDYGVPMAMWDQAPNMGSKKTTQMETVALRFPAQVGPLYNSMYNPISGLVHAYAKRTPDLARKRSLRGFADISYSLDNADAIATVATADKLGHRLYNVSSDIHVTGREILEALYRVAPDAKNLLKLDVAEQPHQPGNEYLDISRFRKDLSWKPRFDIDSMLADYVKWVQHNDY